MYYQQYMGSVAMAPLAGPVSTDIMDMAPMETVSSVFPPLPSSATNEPQLVINKLRER